MLEPDSLLYTVDQIRAIESVAVKEIGEAALMARAGMAVFSLLSEQYASGSSVIVVCGSGNNAGDGYVVARLAFESGWEVCVYTLSAIEDLPPEAKQQAKACHEVGIPILAFDKEADFTEADVIVDAILGIGLNKPVQGEHLEAINRINQFDIDVIAIDVPSGLNADTGVVQGDNAVIANTTVTFLGAKLGLLTSKGPEFCGDLIVDDLGVDEALLENMDYVARVPSEEMIEETLLPRMRYQHKGDFGHVLVIGGDLGYPGAARLCAEAALRAGAGLVSVATHPEHIAAIVSDRPEIMVRGVEDAKALKPLLARATVIAIGPGLGHTSWSHALWEAAIDSDCPMVVDAGAFAFLAEAPVRRADWILTPHPGEAASLLDSTSDWVQADRLGAARALQQRYDGVVVLKGSGTLVQDDSETFVLDAGNPGMATGGMGDVLTGLIAGLLAQDSTLMEAAVVGAQIHSLAADIAAEFGERGLLASDLFEPIHALVNPELVVEEADIESEYDFSDFDMEALDED